MRHAPTVTLASTVVIGFIALGLAGCADSPTAVHQDTSFSHVVAAAQQPLRLGFEKCAIDPAGIWEGAVTGDIAGDLRTELTELNVTGKIWQVRFNWIISAGTHSFTADLAGTLNTATGRVVMNGWVVDGHLEGARVHEEGQLVDAVNSCFAGTIAIMPASAH
jgi:hypothetical protein